ncbi:TPA: DUF1540 domain-containing protein [Clostridium botulinum]|uniref:DUF1540 domain-containing protein n=1 Tax=Clostridium botulinum TaxID=1491 RepID=UPI00035BA835|nr:DUF1540 domain-containing protein [Clostridium botulinum]APH22068.1 hypothetical protein NPD1_966 [Clostridium botulinum]APQ69715.1 hypothetical protein RSJ8_3178 [Clostridium botulinum]EPS54788.1 hypothetical protein CLQ_04678 [Clostridium botulinum Af84]MBN3351013.1 hypothetical protein [Clostridium botulinum]MBN3359006.1 hypothetical protein [Clostridium botulinum]
MDKLICSAENCINNLQGRCTAHSIEVENNDSHSQCKTFAAKGAIETMSRFHNTNLTEGFKGMFTEESNMVPEVNCEVYSCVHNNDRRCNADAIEINGDEIRTRNSSETICSTYNREK